MALTLNRGRSPNPGHNPSPCPFPEPTHDLGQRVTLIWPLTLAVTLTLRQGHDLRRVHSEGVRACADENGRAADGGHHTLTLILIPILTQSPTLTLA